MKAYVLSILSSAIVCGTTELFANKDSAIGKLIHLLGRLLIVVSLLSPLANFTFYDVSAYFESINFDAETYAKSGEKYAYDQKSEIIFSKLEAYILDKANQLQCDISVDISLTEGEYPIPNRVQLFGTVSPYAKEVLSSYIEDTLGIARENQKWN